MNRTDWHHNVMNGIDPELVEEADLPSKRRHVRFRPALLAAACLALLLIGTAVAAGSSEALPGFLSFFRSQPHPSQSGYTSDGWQISITGDKIPLAEFSQEVQTQPTGLVSRTMMSVDSWEEAEEFAGRDLMDNPVLERAKIRARYGFNDENGEFVPCNVLVSRSWMEDRLSFLSVNTSYDVTLSENDPITAIHVDVTFHTEAGSGSNGWTHYMQEGTRFDTSTYTTPSGLTATILTATQIKEEARTDYHAYFIYNGGVWHLAAHCSEDELQELLDQELTERRQAYLVLKETLDAFR